MPPATYDRVAAEHFFVPRKAECGADDASEIEIPIHCDTDGAAVAAWLGRRDVGEDSVRRGDGARWAPGRPLSCSPAAWRC